MKRLLPFIITLFAGQQAFSQSLPDSIYLNFYTDSLKKGSYHYINVEGRFANGRVLPVTTKWLHYEVSNGQLQDNNLWIPFDFKGDSVAITVKLKDRPGVTATRTLHVKKKPDDEKLKTAEELLQEIEGKKGSRGDGGGTKRKKRRGK